MKLLLLFSAALLALPAASFAHPPQHRLNETSLPVITSLSALEKAGGKAIAKEEALDLAFAFVSPALQERLSEIFHDQGKCGGFEVVPGPASLAAGSSLLAGLRANVQKDQAWEAARTKAITRAKKPEIEAALGELKEENLKATVEWLSSYPSRSNRLPDPNRHVNDLEARVRGILESYPGMWSVQQISHSKTKQNSLRVQLVGKARPTEIVVLGGHLDSIVSGWGGGGNIAPGADDNASGSANLLEALRVLVTKGRPDRTVEFFWYAGEESGLLGSAEIAQQYKAAGKDVVAVLQLDMTMFPGAGEFVVGNVTDFTSSWLRDYLVALNDAYLGVKIIQDKCGYACSDHASWYRQGYPTLMPFESDTDRMNRKIHTEKDLIDSTVSFRHSLVFSKIALVFAMDLGNSDLRQPY